ncbi:MAG: hypothetical protein COV76_06710 [Candidatus Omnitrophica bacterium CG11_big_fil_rev_8_21_14_0_20_64_10]|nr:MAG: hypothetical protein COV76_06710 [Candidatus Omnitrophica bacterium CG11_big_fil_rev_8_21_14_0_20_64_10]
MRRIWRNFITGFLVIFPAVLTAYILNFLFGWAFNLVINPISDQIAPWMPAVWAQGLTRFLVAVGFVLVIAGIGLATRILLLRRLFIVGEGLVRRVPIAGKIYGMIREIVDTIGGSQKGVFQEVVLVEWPQPKMYVLGFVTGKARGEVQQKTAEEVSHVFVPTTPNPTSGYLMLVDESRMTHLTMSVEQGMRLVISGGVVGEELKGLARRSGREAG